MVVSLCDSIIDRFYGSEILCDFLHVVIDGMSLRSFHRSKHGDIIAT